MKSAQANPSLGELPRYDATTALSQPGQPLPPISESAGLIGAMLDHYRIVKLLGKGGMGEVYLAEDTRLGHEVAVKVLPAAVAHDAERIRRFEREARLLARLNHPHIATIHLLGQCGALHYLVLEYVPGETLSERLARGKVPVSEALPLLRQLASALGHAHTQPEPIIHRDLKPDNLKLTVAGELKVLDFGLSKSLRSDFSTAETADESLADFGTFSTTHRVIQGTVPYMSPEQTLGQRLDQRTDWWAFGCIGFELLTGVRPFNGFTLDGVLKAINQDAPAWEKLPPETPPALRHLLQQCLQKERQERLASATAAEQLLEQVAAQPRPRFHVVRQHWPKAAWAAALVLLTVFAVSVLPWRRQHTPPPPPVSKPHLAVLPFRANANADLARLGAGLSQALRDGLAASDQLVVLPFGEAVQAEPQNAPAELLRGFGAQYLLDGEVSADTAGELAVKLRLHQSQAADVTESVSGKRADFTELQTTLLEKAQGLLALKRPLPALSGWFKQAREQEQYLTALAALNSDLTATTVEEPIRLLSALTQREPEAARAWAALAQAYLRKGQLTNQLRWIREAERASTEALKLDAALPEVHLTRGYVLSALGDYDAAIPAFSQVLNLRPDELEARLGLAGVYEDKPDASLAETWYKQAVNLWPQYWACHNELGAFYAEQGRYQEAAAELAQVLRSDPQNLSARVNAANAFLKLGKAAESETAYRQLLAELAQRGAQADGEDALLGLSAALFQQDRWQDAAEQARAALQINPASPSAQTNLAEALSRMPDSDRTAREAYTQTIRLYQQSTAGAKGYGRLAEAFAKRSLVQTDEVAKQVDRRSARDTLQRALQTKPERLAVLYSAVVVYALCGQAEEALGALDLARNRGYGLDDFRHDPWLNELGQLPRYQEIMKLAQR